MHGKQCERCGAALSRYATDPVCFTCYTTCALTQPVAVSGPVQARPTWIWISQPGAHALASRNLGTILKAYRKINHISQRELAERLGYDSTYISLLERGLRTISDRRALARLARQLAIPPHVLGVTSDDAAKYLAMLQFGDSVVRLAELARRSGGQWTRSTNSGP
jgi:transcriptional regulator with XRE-family HTH domain